MAFAHVMQMLHDQAFQMAVGWASKMHLRGATSPNSAGVFNEFDEVPAGLWRHLPSDHHRGREAGEFDFEDVSVTTSSCFMTLTLQSSGIGRGGEGPARPRPSARIWRGKCHCALRGLLRKGIGTHLDIVQSQR